MGFLRRRKEVCLTFVHSISLTCALAQADSVEMMCPLITLNIFQRWITLPAFSGAILGHLSALSYAGEGKNFSSYSRCWHGAGLCFSPVGWDPLVFFSPLTKNAHPFVSLSSLTLTMCW